MIRAGRPSSSLRRSLACSSSPSTDAVLPGDPAVFFASGPNAGKEEIEVIRKQMGLNKPVPEQLMLYLYESAAAILADP